MFPVRLKPALLAGLLLSFAATAAAAVPLPSVDAGTWLLEDAGSGRILAAHDAGRRIDPGSLVKLMTARLVFAALQSGRLQPDQRLPVSAHAWQAAGSRMFLARNRPVPVSKLLLGLIVDSGNDAAVALAEALAGSEPAFAAQMNAEAQRLGMRHTHFVNATGLPDPQQWSTAGDLALLARSLIRDYPQDYSLFAVRNFAWNGFSQANHNRLLWQNPAVDGLGAGSSAHGYHLVASACRGPTRLIAVVADARSDAARVTAAGRLLDYGLRGYETRRLYAARQAVTRIRIWKGMVRQLDLGVDQDVVVTLPAGRYPALKATVVTRQPLLAPVAAGQQVGTLKLTLDGRLVAEYPLRALQTVAPAGAFARLIDTVRLWFS